MPELDRPDLFKAGCTLALGAALAGRGEMAGAAAPAAMPALVDSMSLVHPELREAAARIPQMPASFS